MTPHTIATHGPSASWDVAPVLIQVPTLAPRARPSARLRPTSGRRRIRREIRVAASTLAFAVPLSWLLMGFAHLGPEPASQAQAAPAVASAPAPQAADEGPRVTISLDSSEVEAPRVLPAGILLPEDGPEDTAHAGH